MSQTAIFATDDLCVFGQVINFEFDAVTKKARKFPYTFCILKTNKNVLVRLSPSYVVTTKIRLSQCQSDFFSIQAYVFSTKPENFDLKNLIINRNVSQVLKEITKNLYDK